MIRDPYIGMPIKLGGPCDKPPVHYPETPPVHGGGTIGSGNMSAHNPPPSHKPVAEHKPAIEHKPVAEHKPVHEGDKTFDGMFLGSLPIAMAYVPMQQWKTTYSSEKGFHRGTIFPELDLPFEGKTISMISKMGGQNR